MKASGYERVTHDWYQEPSATVEALLDVEQFREPIWDPACGANNIPMVCRARGLSAYGSDIVRRSADYGSHPVHTRGQVMSFQHDFLTQTPFLEAGSIVSNPPYNVLQEWVDRSLDVSMGKVAILGRLAFLEGQARRAWWRTVPLARVWVSSKRLSMPPGGMGIKAKGGTIAYAWFVFDRTHSGPAHLGWL